MSRLSPPQKSRSENVPTINDLRVKECYICREEELSDAPPEGPLRPWAHPCKCTLIAHEQCLLKWIQTAQTTTSKSSKALKCPQCGANYEIDSDNPLILRAIELGDKALQKLGSLFMVFGGATIFCVVSTGVYIVCTGYGAWAVRMFVGNEIYNLLLTDDPSNWPWTAFINLPLLPFSLILSRFFQNSQLSPAIPMLLAWPPSFPLARKLSDYWRLPENARKLIGSSSTNGAYVAGRTWPPSPVLFGLFGLPMVKMLYQALYARVYFKVTGSRPPGWATTLRGDPGQGPIIIRVQQVNRQERAQRPPREGNANADNNEAGNPDDLDAAGEPREQVFEINGSSLGRKIGGALLIPAISSWMGLLLLRLSRYSPLLRSFLAIKRPVGAVWVPPAIDYNKDWQNMGVAKQIGVSAQLVLRALWGNTRIFAESDPVWWRNTVGLGLFVVMKDCIQLAQLYLAKRELESRKVKSRDFSGVDISQLDLVPEYLQRLRR